MKTLKDILKNIGHSGELDLGNMFYKYLDTPIDELSEDDLQDALMQQINNWVIFKEVDSMKTLKDILANINNPGELDLENMFYNYLDTPIDELCRDDLQDALMQHISEQDIIYYHNAIEYLAEHDNSLRESLTLAEGIGYSPSQLNSELLATLLYQQNLTEDYSDVVNDIMVFAESELPTEEA